MIKRIESEYTLTKVGPIIRSDPKSPIMNFKAYNPTLFPTRDEVGNVSGNIMLVRAMADASHMKGSEYPVGLTQMKSRLVMATTTDGIHYNVESQRVVMDGEGPEEAGGVEDPYAVVHPDDTGKPDRERRIVLTYTAYNNQFATPALAITGMDMNGIERHGSMLPRWDKGMWFDQPRWTKAARVLPNRMPNGRFGMVVGDWDIWYMESDDLTQWTDPKKVATTDSLGVPGLNHLEMGPVIETAEHYILGIHGVTKKPDQTCSYEYGLFMTLMAKDEPGKLISVLSSPVLRAEEDYERGCYVDADLDFSKGGFIHFVQTTQEERRRKVENGEAGKAVFATTASPLPEGTVKTAIGKVSILPSTVGIPYGAADELTAMALGDKDEIEALLLRVA